MVSPRIGGSGPGGLSSGTGRCPMGEKCPQVCGWRCSVSLLSCPRIGFSGPLWASYCDWEIICQQL